MGRISKKKVKEAIKASGGVIAAVARQCDVTRQAMWNFFHKEGNESFLEMLKQEDDAITDLAENKMNTKINDGHWPAIKFRLESKGASRGFVTKQEIEHVGDQGPSVFQLIEKSIEEIKDEKVRGKPEQTIDNKSEASGDAESPRGQ